MRLKTIGAFLVTFALGTGLGAYTNGRLSQETNYLADIPRYVDSTRFEPVPGVSLETAGLTMEVHHDSKKWRLPKDTSIRFDVYDYVERADKALQFDHSALSLGLNFVQDYDSKGRYALNFTPLNLVRNYGTEATKQPHKRYLQVKATISRNYRETEVKHFYILADPFLVEDDDLIVAADRIPDVSTEEGQATLKAIHRQVREINHLIAKRQTEDPETFYPPVETVALTARVSKSLQGAHSYAASPQERCISGVANSLGNKPVILAGITHETIHFLFPALRDEQKEKVYQAFAAMRQLAGYSVNDRLSSGLLGPTVDAEENPIFAVFDEDEVLPKSAGDTEISHVGHPYDNASEMLASMVAMCLYSPEKVHANLQRLKPSVRVRYRREVMAPCVKALNLPKLTSAFAKI